ncbi:MAG: amidohydrolase, partial [Candidatus Aminicenantes bacterium]|nr:amidohydrolase [Candidatus Aminicenantes bacterium]
MGKSHLKLIILLMFSLMQLTFAESRPSIKELKNELLRMVDQKSQLLIEVSDALWEYAEIALLEYESSKLLIQALEKEGFEVERKVAGMPTAFVASYGSGKPIIGILAEYDALPGLSQDSTPYKKERIEGGAGHGCGHNLFGAG